jgi:hypothetical protein
MYDAARKTHQLHILEPPLAVAELNELYSAFEVARLKVIDECGSTHDPSKWTSQESEAAPAARLSQGGQRVSVLNKKSSVEEVSFIHEAKHEELDEVPQAVEQPQPPVASGEGRRSRACSRWRFLRCVIMIGIRLIHHLYDVRAVRKANSYSTKLPKNVVLKVKTEKERKQLCISLQGDVDMYKEDVLCARLKLRHDPAVLEPLHEFWATAQRSVQQAAIRAEASDLKKEEYVRVMVLVGKAMLKNFSQVEARHEAENDWAADAKDPSAVSISREAFMDAIFQLADHWTLGVSCEEYASFLWRLLGAYRHLEARQKIVLLAADRVCAIHGSRGWAPRASCRRTEVEHQQLPQRRVRNTARP